MSCRQTSDTCPGADLLSTFPTSPSGYLLPFLHLLPLLQLFTLQLYQTLNQPLFCGFNLRVETWKERLEGRKGQWGKVRAGGMEEKHFYKEDKTNFPKGNWTFNDSNLHGKWKAKTSGLNTASYYKQQSLITSPT